MQPLFSGASDGQTVTQDEVINEWFSQADNLLFKERKYAEAQLLYEQINKAEQGQNIDAINSIAYCLKFKAAATNSPPGQELYETLHDLYKSALLINRHDVEANFNMGLLYLQFGQDLNKALDSFRECVSRDGGGDDQAELFKAQFAKAYYNIGMIYDKMGQVQSACEGYLQAMKKCQEDTSGQLLKSSTYKKAGTNYAVTLEKLGRRDEAVETLNTLKKTFGNEVRVFNNLGIIQKRTGDKEGALKSYQSALNSDESSFFPNYNLGVLLSQEKETQAQSLECFDRALNQAHKAQEFIYEINVLLNIALIQEADGSFQKALDYLERALLIDPQNEQIQLKIKSLKEHLQRQSQTSHQKPTSSSSKTRYGKEELLKPMSSQSQVRQQDSALSETQQKLKEQMLQVNRESASRSSAKRRSRPGSQGSDMQLKKDIEEEAEDLLNEVQVVDPIERDNNADKEKEMDMGVVENIGAGIKADEYDAVVSPRNGEISHTDMMDLEIEAERILESKESKKTLDGIEKSIVEQEAKSLTKVPSFAGWLNWNKEECEVLRESENQEERLRALYRLGLIYQAENDLQAARQAFEDIQKLDENFCKEQVHLRLAEVYYKLGDIQKANEYIAKVEKDIKDKDKYMVHLLKGKCFDKEREFQRAVLEYEQALKQCQEQQMEDGVLGNIQFRLGWSMIRSKINVEKGTDHLKQSVALLPDNTEVMVKLAGVLFQEGASSEADINHCQQLLKKTLELEPDNYEALLLQGKLEHTKEQYKESIASLERAIQLHANDQNKTQGQVPPKANSFYYLGMSYEKLKDFKKAMQCFKKCLTIDNNHFGACIHLANLLANLGEGQRAAKYFKHAIKIDQESVNAHFGLGKALQQYSEDKEAPIPHFQEVLKRDPEHFKTLTQLGILYLDKEDFEKSADYLKKALQANKSFPLALVSMGNLLFETGHAESAIKYHQQALKFNDKELQALIGLGNAYYDTGKPDEAVFFYKKALEIDNQLSDVHYNLGNALYLQEVIDEAIKHYKSAIQLNPKKPESFYNLGNALCVKNEYTNAVAAYETAIELDPRNAPAYYNLGNALYMLNKFEESVKAYQQALSINTSSPECHFNLASAYNDLGDYPRAIKHYKEAINLDGTNLDAQLCLATVLEQVNKVDQAISIYEGVLEIDGQNTKALEGLAKIRSGGANN